MDDVKGTISSTFSGTFTRWDVNVGGESYTLSQTFSGNSNRWELSGGDLDHSVTISTVFSDNFGSWEMSGLRISTTFSNDFGGWDISGNASELTAGEKAVAAFIPVLVGKGIIKKL
jgi:hypothetical protein